MKQPKILEFFVRCFISGVKDSVENGVTMFEPTALAQAIGLTRLQEDTMEAVIRETKASLRANTPMGSTTHKSATHKSIAQETLPPIRHISQEEMDACRAKRSLLSL